MKKTVLLACIVMLTYTFSWSQQNQPKNDSSPEYMTIMGQYSRGKIKRLVVSGSGTTTIKTFEVFTRSKQEVLETIIITGLLEKYGKEGWLVQSSNITGRLRNFRFYYLLRR